jgi:hypothetical protein
MNEFIDTSLETTSNYSAIADFHAVQITSLYWCLLHVICNVLTYGECSNKCASKDLPYLTEFFSRCSLRDSLSFKWRWVLLQRSLTPASGYCLKEKWLRASRSISRVGEVCVTYRRVLDWMIGFIAPYTFTARDNRQYNAIAVLHASQFTVTHALGLSVFTSRVLATDFITVSL